MKSAVYTRMQELGVVLPPPLPDQPCLVMLRPFGDRFLYVSGMGPLIEGETPLLGKIPTDVSPADGIAAARNCILNALSVLDDRLGDLGKIKRFVKLLTYVSSDPGFCDQSEVANGGSQLLIDIFGKEIGSAARSAVGVATLPKNFPVEIEMLLELNDQL